MDIGSNFGYYSLTMAKHLDGDCRIDAFEPFPQTFAKLKTNVDLNSFGCIRAHQLALGASPGVLPMVPVEGNTGAAYLLANASKGAGLEVAVTTLDLFVSEQGIIRMDFVKIDVEGFEYSVLDGGKNSFTRFKPVVMIEVCPENLARNGKTTAMIIEKLREYGYRSFHVASCDGVAPFTEHSFDGGWAYRNVFCFAEGRSWTFED